MSAAIAFHRVYFYNTRFLFDIPRCDTAGKKEDNK